MKMGSWVVVLVLVLVVLVVVVFVVVVVVVVHILGMAHTPPSALLIPRKRAIPPIV
jgi:hypothetical protein